MSDKRRRFRKPKEEKQASQRTITIVRRNNNNSNNVEEPSSSSQRNEPEMAPKILLKPKTSERDDENVASVEVISKKGISTRNEILSAQSTNISSAKQDQQDQISVQFQESMPAMTRPATILSSTSVISSNVKRLFKDNSDFFVVGVIGTQGVGKSTILNLLANEDIDCDYYQKIFLDEEGYFPTKLKQFKNPSRSRTESTHMFITTDRMILLDIAPIMCNSYKKDMTTNELDDLHALINSLSVCHLVIVVYKDYLNMNFLRLLRLAELMKPDFTNYFPNLMFLKNRAKRYDFSLTAQKLTNDMLENFFKDSKLRIYRGQTGETQLHLKRSSTECELLVNSFVFPEVKGLDAMPYHKPLVEIIDDLRWLVFTTPRNEISPGGDQFTELVWFDLFEKVAQQTQHFFFKTYDDIHRNHFDGGNNGREMQENWKD